MARYRGTGGDVYVDQSTAGNAAATPMRYIAKWTLDGSTAIIPVTAFGDTTEVSVAGLPSAKGTATGFADNTATTGSTALFTMAQSGVARKTYLYSTTPSTSGPYWFGTAYWDVSYDTSVDGAVSISCNWAAATPFSAVG